MGHTLLYTGGTGCGKTYKAVTESDDFVITVPCRQLAYEVWWDYQHKIGRIDTGEVHFSDGPSNRVCVYENLSEDDVIEQGTLIVDEAQYLNDPDRGGALLQKVINNRAAGKQIILLTATDTLSNEVKQLLNVKKVEVKPFVPPPKKVRLDRVRFANRVYAGMQTIVFCRRIPTDWHVDYYAKLFGIDKENIATLSSDTPSFERLSVQIAFKQAEIQVVLATNLLAQGLNFPAEGVWIEHDPRDTWSLVQQKIGRVARPHFGMTEGYYCINRIPQPQKHYGIPDIIEETAVGYWRPSGERIDISTWGFLGHEVPTVAHGYRGIKYARRFLCTLERETGHLEPEEREALDFLEVEEAKIASLLLERPVVHSQ